MTSWTQIAQAKGPGHSGEQKALVKSAEHALDQLDAPLESAFAALA